MDFTQKKQDAFTVEDMAEAHQQCLSLAWLCRPASRGGQRAISRSGKPQGQKRPNANGLMLHVQSINLLVYPGWLQLCRGNAQIIEHPINQQ